MRWLVWLALGFLVYLATRSKARSVQENLRRAAREQVDPQSGIRSPFTQAQSSPAVSERMVACHFCQLYLPASEAITLNTAHYCCTEHAHAAETTASTRASSSE